jgi:hypothetical protein
MHCHPNARRTPRGRAEVFGLVEAGMTVTAACMAARVSRRFYYRWLPAWRAAGEAGLVDRSCRPHSSPRVRARAKLLPCHHGEGASPQSSARVGARSRL